MTLQPQLRTRCGQLTTIIRLYGGTSHNGADSSLDGIAQNILEHSRLVATEGQTCEIVSLESDLGSPEVFGQTIAAIERGCQDGELTFW